jgi:hypothetical protein
MRRAGREAEQRHARKGLRRHGDVLRGGEEGSSRKGRTESLPRSPSTRTSRRGRGWEGRGARRVHGGRAEGARRTRLEPRRDVRCRPKQGKFCGPAALLC